MGRVVYVPALPARFVAGPGLRLGAVIPTPAVRVLPALPTVVVHLPSVLAAAVRPGTSVSVEVGDRTVRTSVSGPPSAQSDGSVTVPLQAADFRCEVQACPTESTGRPR